MRSHPYLLSFAFFSLLLVALPQAAHARLARAADEVLSKYTRTVYEDGTVLQDLEGSNVVELRDGSSFTVGTYELVDPDGNEYYIVGDAYQESEESPVIYEVRLVRSVPEVMTEEEILAEYLEGKPDSSQAEIDAFLARRASRLEMPVREMVVEDGVLDWYGDAAADEMLQVAVIFETQPPLSLPRLHNSLVEEDPVFWLDQMEDRIIAIEERKTEIEDLHSTSVAEIERLGGSLLAEYWIINGLEIEATPDVLEYLMESSGVRRIEEIPEETLASNQGEELREAMQIKQYLDAGFNGELGSGQSEVSDIFVAVVDQCFDPDHPVWKDSLYSHPSTRLEDVYCYDSGAWTTDPADCQANYTCWTVPSGGTQHGTRVAGQLVGDLTQGQDANYPGSGTADQLARTGFSTESAIAFIETQGVSNVLAFEKVIELNADIANYSINHMNTTRCNTDHSYNAEIDNVMHNGTMWFNSAGNAFDINYDCTVYPPATASGAFTVASAKKDQVDLQDGEICPSSSRGGHPSLDYAMIDLTAIGGRQGYTTPDYDDTYGLAGGCCTSYATPAAAGAAANMKHHFLTIFDTADVNDVGLLYASMLAMGDGQLQTLNKMTATTPNDPRWGAGRMRMRLLTGPGMDSPWRWRYYIGVIGDGQTKSIRLNPDDYGVNQPVPDAADWFKAALWYHEPNLETGETPAEISLKVVKSPTQGYVCSSFGPQRQRLWLGSALTNDEWTVKIKGLNATTSTDESDPLFEQAKRKVFLAFYWEGDDWDDSDGPSVPMH